MDDPSNFWPTSACGVCFSPICNILVHAEITCYLAHASLISTVVFWWHISMSLATLPETLPWKYFKFFFTTYEPLPFHRLTPNEICIMYNSCADYCYNGTTVKIQWNRLLKISRNIIHVVFICYEKLVSTYETLTVHRLWKKFQSIFMVKLLVIAMQAS